MSGKERYLFRMIFKNFIASINPKLKQPTVLVGEDHYGTKYYELQKAANSSKKHSSRYFVPVNKDDHEQELPVEWEAWLRHRRKDPPTVEEIEKNYQLQLIKKQKAAEIEATCSSTEPQESMLSTQKDGYRSFPTYEEYNNNGQDYKVKYSK